MRCSVFRIIVGLMLATMSTSAQTGLLTHPLSPYRIPTVADHAGEALMAMRRYSQEVQSFNSGIEQARKQYFGAYQGGPPPLRVSQEFSTLLMAKDYFFLIRHMQSAATGGYNAPTIVLDAVSGQLDGGISPTAIRAYNRWANEVTDRLLDGRAGLSGALRFLAQASGDPEELRAKINESDNLYQQYVVLRDLEEFRKYGVVPHNFPKTAWQMALVGVEYVNIQSESLVGRDKGPENPYMDALTAHLDKKDFQNKCESAVNNIFGSVKSNSCTCLQNLFSEVAYVSDQWKLQTEFSESRLLAMMVADFGTKGRSVQCIK